MRLVPADPLLRLRLGHLHRRELHHQHRQEPATGIPRYLLGGSALVQALVRAGFSALLLHEHYHHKTECMGLRLHVVEQTSRYVPYFRGVYIPAAGSVDQLEEGLANGDSFLRLRTEPYSKWVRGLVRTELENYLVEPSVGDRRLQAGNPDAHRREVLGRGGTLQDTVPRRDAEAGAASGGLADRDAHQPVDGERPTEHLVGGSAGPHSGPPPPPRDDRSALAIGLGRLARAAGRGVARCLGSVHICDDDGTELPPGEIGQVWFKARSGRGPDRSGRPAPAGRSTPSPALYP